MLFRWILFLAIDSADSNIDFVFNHLSSSLTFVVLGLSPYEFSRDRIVHIATIPLSVEYQVSLAAPSTHGGGSLQLFCSRLRDYPLAILSISYLLSIFIVR